LAFFNDLRLAAVNSSGGNKENKESNDRLSLV